MFENILGQDIAKRFIKNSIKKNKLGHAYLFEGPIGVGKKDFVREFSKILMDSNDLEINVDFKEIYPDKNSLKIEQIRAMQSDLIIKPYKNKKVYVFYDCESMTVQAQNSFLKTLENPPNYAVIILISNNSYSILDTIKSRCEVVKFHYISSFDIENYLINKKGLSNEKARVIASFSNGTLSKANQLVEDKQFSLFRDEIKNLIKDIFSLDVVKTISVIDYLVKNKNNIAYVLDTIIIYFRDSIICKEKDCEKLIINIDEMDFVYDLSEKLTYFQICTIIDIIDEVSKKIISNCNYSLCLDVMVFNIQEVIK